MNYILYSILLCVKTDNEEISVTSFDKLIVRDQSIFSKDISGYNSVKISFLGNNVCRIIEIDKGVFKFVDIGVYFDEKEANFDIRIDYELKYYGLTLKQWGFIGSMVLIAIFTSIIIELFYFDVVKYFK